ncbi:MAG TPA: FG-GAP-like repeat-containing protein [Acidobacteriota bacterium]|nr:FG-GAP-like repeat-containing protein [Acidobacteriota bacterium]
MRRLFRLAAAALPLAAFVLRGPVFAQGPQVVSTSPSQHGLHVPTTADISVTFDTDMNGATIDVTTFVVNTRSAGFKSGVINYDGGTSTASFTPAEVFTVGEVVTVVLTTGIQSSGGSPLENSFSWSFTAAADTGTGIFAPHVDYPAGGRPYQIYAADLDGDGDQDLAGALYYDNQASVLLNNGEGTFALDATYPVGASPISIHAGDLDRDGDLDLATADRMESSATVLFNNGDGTFTPDSVYPVGSYSTAIEIEDIDGDGHLDLIVSNGDPDNVSVLLNNGDGTFAPRTDYYVGPSPWGVCAADLDNDGDMDLVTPVWGVWQSAIVLLNDGTGAFTWSEKYYLGPDPREIYVTDLDGDGDADLVSANSSWPTDSGSMSFVKNNGNATFAPQMTYGVGGEPWTAYAADLTGDGSQDVIIGNTRSGTISLFFNNGSATFPPRSSYEVAPGPAAVVAADFDGDGDLDVATAGYGAGNVSILINTNIPHFLAHGPVQNALNVPVSAPVSVTFDIDMDGAVFDSATMPVNGTSMGLYDGIYSYDDQTRTVTFDPATDWPAGEVVTVTLTTDILSYHGLPLESSHCWSFTATAAHEAGYFEPQVSYAVGDEPMSVAVADLDDDGDLDAVTANRSSNSVSVLLNDGEGTLVPFSAYPAGDDPVAVIAADLDADGHPDLATANELSDDVSVLLGRGDGSFEAQTAFSIGGRPTFLCAVDLDRDADLDLAVTNADSDAATILLNAGDGTFTNSGSYPTGDAAGIVAADLDTDGDMDLAVSNWSGPPDTVGSVSILLNNGDGTFAAKTDFAAGLGAQFVCASDLDADGDMDLAAVSHYNESVSVLLNNGDGTFEAYTPYAVGEGPRVVVAADFDGDGDPDLAATNYYNYNVSVLASNGDGTFAPQAVYAAGSNPHGLFAADLNGNGTMDVVTANAGSDSLSVLLNQIGTDVEPVPGSILPETYSLEQNYPNPFNPSTRVQFSLPRVTHVRLTVLNVLGQEVVTLVSRTLPPGQYEAEWNGVDAHNEPVATGLYLYRLQAGDYVETRKMMLLK